MMLRWPAISVAARRQHVADEARAAIDNPAGERDLEVGEAEQPGMDVEGDLEPACGRLVDDVHRSAQGVGRGARPRHEVRDLEPDAGPAGGVDRLAHRFDGMDVLVAGVGRVQGATASDALAQRFDVGGGRGALGRVLETGREAEGALVERLVEERLDRRLLGLGGGAPASAIAVSRSVPCGTSAATLTAGRAASTASR